MQKKSMLIFFVIIISLLFIAIYCIFQGKKTSKTEDFYNKITESKNFTFTMEIDNENLKFKVNMIKKDEDICIDMNSDDGHTTTLSTEKGTYYIVHDEQEYYYNDEKSDVEIDIYQLKELIKNEFNSGKEVIDGKEFYYEEFKNENGLFNIYADFDEESDVKIRFYYDENNLVYIKNIITNEENQHEELIKSSLKYEIDETLFTIPDNYAEVEE